MHQLNKHLGLFIGKRDFEKMMCFIDGLDYFNQTTILKEFRDWLKESKKCPANFVTKAKIEYYFSNGNLSQIDPIKDSESLIKTFFELFFEFVNLKEITD